MNFNSNTTAGGRTASVSDFTFDSMLDEACERLLDRQLMYSIQRIYEMEKRLVRLERELDDFLIKPRESGVGSRESDFSS